jgi:YidC/Oxa1 family membrane protein insertase
MEKRLLLALLLSAIVFVVYEWLYPPQRPNLAGANANGTPSAAAAGSTAAPGTTATSATPAPGLPTPSSNVTQAPITAPAESLDVRTTDAVFRFTNIGAAPVSIEMLHYQSMRARTQNVALSPVVRYQIVGSKDTLDLSRTAFQMQRTASGVNFTGEVKGSRVDISYTIPAQGYQAAVTGKVSGPAATDTSYLLAELPPTFKSAEADTTDDQNHFAYAVKPVREDPQGLSFAKLDTIRRVVSGPLSWVAARNKYFVIGFLTAPSAPFAEADLIGTAKAPGAKTKTVAHGTVIQPVKNGAFGFELYAGPQEYNRLHALGRDFEDVNPYGGFLHGVMQPFATIIVRIMIWMRGELQLNYGWIIIIFGIAIRVLLWPLNQRAMRTSLRMQVLQPEIQAVQERYKNDSQRLQQEMMKVYGEHGLSPLSPIIGCLPMLIPLPILYCLLFVLQNTIAFRGVSFLWLHDISLKDPYYILPLIMGASSYLVSWIGMRNSPPNPQAKMMTYVFPAMMTFLLANYSAGLNLYYAVQNVATLPQQWFLSNERAKAAAARG